ncbi:MAG TPA: porin, partial [Vicinamibacteria bacterium]|nr:porin [Vicinamibacteria bacterium]
MPNLWRVVLLAAVLSPPARAGWAADEGDLKIELHGYLQFDGRFYPGAGDGDAGTDSFLLRRVRPSVQGTLGRHFEFTLTPDFGGGAAVVQDAYLEVTLSRALQVRAGKFKPPVGLERLQSATDLALVERALTSGLSPNRDVGLQLQGEVGAGVLTYAAGVFDGAPDGGSLDG